MAMAASFRGGPFTTNTLTNKKYLWIHIILIYTSSLLPLYQIWTHIPTYANNEIYFILTLPFYMFGWYSLWVFCAIISSAVVLKFANLFHKPKEGYFQRVKTDKDYQHWSLRSTIKKFALWLSHNYPFPWIDLLAYKLYGVKLKGKLALFDAFVDTEFIEIGKNTIVGQVSMIASSMVTRDWLIIRKVEIGDNVVIGGYALVSPGTKIGNNVVLGAHSYTTIGQELESGWVYVGMPAKKFKKTKYLSEEESDEFMKVREDRADHREEVLNNLEKKNMQEVEKEVQSTNQKEDSK